jgi:hypothetical protein
MKPSSFMRLPFKHRRLIAATLLVTTQLAVRVNSATGVASKIFVASIDGESEINRGEKIEAMKIQAAYRAEGCVIETKPAATNALVYSNGTGIFFDPETRLEVRKFKQEPFVPNRNDLEVEPSVSETEALLSRGTIGLCTGRLVSGSSMKYQTSLGSVSMQSGKIVIESTPEESRISVLSGEGLVRGGALDLGGQVVHEGEQAVIRRGASQESNQVVVQKIPERERPILDEKVFAACSARKTVFFESKAAAGGGDAEVVAVPVVPNSLPVPVTVSPSTLPR